MFIFSINFPVNKDIGIFSLSIYFKLELNRQFDKAHDYRLGDPGSIPASDGCTFFFTIS